MTCSPLSAHTGSRLQTLQFEKLLCLQLSLFQRCQLCLPVTQAQSPGVIYTSSWPGDPSGSTFTQYPESSLSPPLPPSSSPQHLLSAPFQEPLNHITPASAPTFTQQPEVLSQPRKDLITHSAQALWRAISLLVSEKSNCALGGPTGLALC